MILKAMTDPSCQATALMQSTDTGPNIHGVDPSMVTPPHNLESAPTPTGPERKSVPSSTLGEVSPSYKKDRISPKVKTVDGSRGIGAGSWSTEIPQPQREKPRTAKIELTELL